jgi:hypothetical protein
MAADNISRSLYAYISILSASYCFITAISAAFRLRSDGVRICSRLFCMGICLRAFNRTAAAGIRCNAYTFLVSIYIVRRIKPSDFFFCGTALCAVFYCRAISTRAVTVAGRLCAVFITIITRAA